MTVATKPVTEETKPVTEQTPTTEQTAKTEQESGTRPTDTTVETTKVEPKPTKLTDLLTVAGLNPKEAMSEFSKTGEVSIEVMQKLVEKHGDAVAGLIVGQMKGLYTEGVEASKQRDAAIYSQVEEAFKGVTTQTGEETWNELATWAKTNVPEETRAEVNAMLKQGGLASKLAVDFLVSTFNGSDDYVQPAELLEADSAAKGASMTPLSRQEYNSELRKLEAKGHVYGQSKEIARLQERRLAGQRRGI